MGNKDFLSQFSGENKKQDHSKIQEQPKVEIIPEIKNEEKIKANKPYSTSEGRPASFQEEERVKIVKEKKPINIKLVIIIVLAVLLVIGGVLFFVLRPTIEVKNFVGEKSSEVTAWIRQNQIETSGVIFKEEYSKEYDKDIIISQSIEPETKIRKNAKMDFIVSLGADPEEFVSIPDFYTMTKSEIQSWISENKLTKTKVMSSYSDEKEDGEIISIDFKNADESSFKRSSTLTINISKGPKPAGVVEVPDFTKKNYLEAETWAKNNKIELVKVTSYSDKIDKDLIISQSVEAKKEIKQGDTFTIVVSNGKAVYAKNLVGLKLEEAQLWASKNGVSLITSEEYTNDYKKGVVFYQSVEPNAMIKDELKIVVSLGKPEYIKHTTVEELEKWVEGINEKGASVSIDSTIYENSDSVKAGEIIDVINSGSYISVGTKLIPVVSLGKNIWLLDSYETTDSEGNKVYYLWKEVCNYDEDYARKLCELAGVTYEVIYQPSFEKDAHQVISVKRNYNQDNVEGGTYISQAEVVIITISNERIKK